MPSSYSNSNPSSWGALIDVYSNHRNRIIVKQAQQQGLELIYYYSPERKLLVGWLDILPAAAETFRRSLKTGSPMMLIHRGDKVPLKFRFPREIEVAVTVAWPDRKVWARKGVLNSRSTSDQMAFLCATGLELPVADRRVSAVRRQQAIAVAIALIAVSCSLPLPACPYGADNKGRTARDLAREHGLDPFLIGWR